MSAPQDNTERIAWWRQIWLRLAVSFFVVTTLPLLATAIYTTRRHLEVVRAVATEAAAARAGSMARALQDTLATARHDLLALSESPVLQSYLATRHGPAEEASFWRQKLIVQLRTFADLKPAYRSIQCADETGGDLIRMERRGTATGVAESSPPVGALPWLDEALQLLTRQAALHARAGPEGVEVTYATRVRSALPGPRQLLWIELVCEPRLGTESPGQVAIYGPDGACLFPQDCRALPGSGAQPSTWIGDVGGAQLLISRAVVQLREDSARDRWVLALLEPAAVLDEGVRDFRAAFLGVLAAALALAVGLGVWLARQLTLPLRQLYEASRRIGPGDFEVDVDVSSDDEVGALARAVEHMAGRLRESHEDLERRLDEKTARLVHSERLATIGRTAAVVAHEINNPSGVISLYAQMLTEKLPADDPLAHKLRLIDAKAREIALIVSELRDYSREPIPVREWIETEALLGEALESAGVAKAPSACVESAVEVHPMVARLHVDSHQMARVLRNLIVNAYHAMPAGGRLHLRCRPNGSGGACLEVSDDGAGMSAEQLQHVFEPFYSTKRFGAGTGLGLAISKEIVERHGGTIHAASPGGKGTTVTIILPGNEAS